ncbi:MAG: hypothetical protein LC799_25140 [Actinobacteria bacterium]|nr:hypothetical protein [Actinomycetota bacterium]
MIIWVNGPFGAGKTTLLEELSKRLDTAMTVDPELLGFALRNGSASAHRGLSGSADLVHAYRADAP